MNSLEATGRVIDALEKLHIPYILVGAFSSNAYSIARSTNDADFVVSLEPGDLRKLMDQLGGDFRMDPQMHLETFTASVKNVITYVPTKFEIELFRLGTDAHHAERFRRRCRRRIGELATEAWIPTAEDVIIQKLRWKRRKDLDDAQNVLAVQLDKLEWGYLEAWTEVHGTAELLRQLRDEIGDLDTLDDKG